ncbi:MAG: glycosyltransferase family 4 protein [Planctomycetota bacterium]
MKNPDLKATPDTASPVFGFLLFGGPLSGALVRDARLANELARRGWPVHVWWAMEREKDAPLDARIQQRWLFHGFRYLPPWASGLADMAGRLLTAATHDKNRARSAQKRHEFLRRVMEGLMRRVCAGVERDRRLLRRFAGELDAAGVTHLLPMLAVLCPWAAAVQRLRPQLRYLVTFQGYELYVNYARNRGQEQDLFARFRDLVERSGMPAVAVSEDYVTRVHEDVGVPAERLRAIPPGVPVSEPMDHDEAVEKVARKFPAYRRGVPLVTYLGRRDTEKGIDLLLYAARILLARGVDLQVAVVGPTLFGTRYAEFCQQLAQDLRCPVLWSNKVPNELRSALFVASRCIVYPSIHREPFGMVSVEALAHGTPAVVPDHGGVAGTIEAAGETAGLRFRVWDSGDLATQIERLIREDGLHGRLAALGPRVAEFYSVANLADRVLRHLGLPPRPGAPGPDNRAEMTPPATATVVSS